MTRTFYDASAAEEEDRRRLHGRGDNTVYGTKPKGKGTRRCLLWMTPQSTSAGPFRRRAHDRLVCCSAGFLRRASAILRARAAGSGERGRPAGTSEERERAIFGGVRERVLSEREWPFEERE
jgi:hypothetical protein